MLFRRTKRETHYVPLGEGQTLFQGAQTIRDAVENGTELTAACGYVWMPIANSYDAIDNYPPCAACFTAAIEDLYSNLAWITVIEAQNRLLREALGRNMFEPTITDIQTIEDESNE